MTEKELRQWLKWEKLDDRWYPETPSDSPAKPLQEILLRAYQEGQSRVAVLHESLDSGTSANWVTVDVSSRLSDDERAQVIKSRRRSFLILAQAGVLVVVALLVMLALALMKEPEPNEGTLSQEDMEQEALLARLQYRLKTAKPEELEKFRANYPSVMVNLSEQFIYVTNLGKDEWEDVHITVNKNPEWSQNAGQPVPGGSTYHVPLRVLAGRDAQEVRENLTAVTVKVPGYDTWEQDL